MAVRTPAAAARVVLSAGLASLGAAAGSIRLLSEDGAELVRLATEGYTVGMLAASPGRLPLDSPAPVCHAARTGEAVFVADQDAYDRRFRAAGGTHIASGYHASAIVPLVVGGRILGCLALSYGAPQRFGRAQRAYATTLAELVAQALDRTRLYEAERECAAVAEGLARVGALLSATLEPATLYARLLEHFSLILPYDHASVLLHEGGWAVVAGSRGRITVPAGLRLFPVADMVLPLAAGDGGRPVLVRDTAGLGWIRVEPFVGAHSIRSVLVVPLLADGQVVGSFNVDSFTPGFYAERHLALAVTLGEYLAQALRNARLYAAERERARVAEELGRLRTVEAAEAAAFEAVGAALNASLEPRALYSLILAQVTRVLPCDHACVAMYDEESVTFEATWGTPHIAPGTSFPRRALWFPEGQRAPVYVPDALALPGWFAVPPLRGPFHDRSLIAAPLRIDGRAVGSFDVSSRTPHFYTPHHLRLAARFAEHVTQALRNARLYAAERARAAAAEERAAARQAEAEEAAVLARIGAALGGSLDPERLYALILEQAGRVLPGDFAVVALYVDGWATVVAALGDPAPPAGTRLFPSDTERMWLPDPGIPLSYVPDTEAEPSWRDLPPWVGADRRRSVISVPLRTDGTVLGYFSFASRTPHAYAERHLRLAGLCAERASHAVRNARLFAAEQARARAAEDLVRARDDFVASVSHELRTPLTAIVGFGELLEARWDATEDAHRRATVRKIVASASRQQRLVDDLLLLSRLEGGALDVRRAPVPLRPLLGRASEEVRLSYPGQGVDLAGPPGLLVLVDGDRLVQVVANLIDNAAKYSCEDSPIAVGWRAEGGMGVIRVRDRGPGIPDAHRGLLFTRFGRVPGSRIRAGHVGTGLGLYLSRQLAEAMGGDLGLEATGPEGSVFRLRVPLAGT